MANVNIPNGKYFIVSKFNGNGWCLDKGSQNGTSGQIEKFPPVGNANGQSEVEWLQQVPQNPSIYLISWSGNSVLSDWNHR